MTNHEVKQIVNGKKIHEVDKRLHEEGFGITAIDKEVGPLGETRYNYYFRKYVQVCGIDYAVEKIDVVVFSDLKCMVGWHVEYNDIF